MRVTSKGQVTIPRDLRELAGISANSEVIFGVRTGRSPSSPSREHRGSQTATVWPVSWRRSIASKEPAISHYAPTT